jgi:6-phosphogluconolactonase (cycloisomerase 2 family)
VYVADTGRDEISQFGSSPSGSGALRPLTPKTVASGPSPYDIAVSPQGTSIYAVDSPSGVVGEVSQYTINPATGKLTPKSPKTVPAAKGPSGIIAVTPDGKNAYVPDDTAKAISQYRISPATGKLTPMSPRTVADPGGPTGIKVAPDGRYAYITNAKLCIGLKGKCALTTKVKADTVSVFRISPGTGALSARPVQAVAAGDNPQMITIAPDGKSAYVTGTGYTRTGGGTIWQYSINPATGKLTPKSPETVATGRAPKDRAITPDGKNLYVVTVANDTVSQYRINPHTGALSARPASTAATMLHPEASVLAQFAISPATGKITPLSGIQPH